ncbi:ATP synthase F1 subunit delta [Psychromonas sp. CNPT3]|uniref:F0F1 ATP synthase subunit delta n=1 Tax=Psychromonas sp. CNPT3 TaxID=314282 RepID=UPI00006E7929|nr:F0F1 ATP synthase subunit delta [Psychromonas sp. CNPT3]AGH79977.1 ATP synthase F1 subunit delta [Psychromonas sp. CNPT3]
MSELTTVARPYARAAFEFANENNNIDTWYEMLVFASAIVENPTMAEILKSDRAKQEIGKLFIEVCSDQLDKNAQNLINVMVENGRLTALPTVTALFYDLVIKNKKEIDVNVVSAYVLSKKQKTELIAALEKRLALKVNINCSIDKTLITGMMITAGDLVIDSTAKSQLNRLFNTLQS